MLRGNSRVADLNQSLEEVKKESFNSHMIIRNKHLFPGILHEMFAQVMDQEGNGCGITVLILKRDIQRVSPLVGEEHL